MKNRLTVNRTSELLKVFPCLLILFIGFTATVATTATHPEGTGQLENPPVKVSGGIDHEGRKYSYLGQISQNGKLILTASNGFFTSKTCVAQGTSSLPKVGDEKLIAPNYKYLEWRESGGTLRWHILISTPGKVHFNAHLDEISNSAEIEVSFGEEIKKVKPSGLNAENLVFNIKHPGEYQLSLRAVGQEGKGKVGNLARIDAFGPGIEGAHLLRVRWRPSAAHGGYDTDKNIDVKTLVFTTRSEAPVSSYSPITTPFGYYGSGFDSDRRTSGFFNFSMWGKEDSMSNLNKMPHLLGVGSPEGEFSGFGHEGSGVKPRGWTPMPDRPELVVQALRVESGEKYDTYYGYYYDHPTNAWKFFAAGNKWHGGKPKKNLNLGSFCEVPGPPSRQRSGDLYREVRRKLWYHDNKDSWNPLENYHAGGNGSKGDIPVNKSWYTTSDGEYAMGCGGIRLYTHEPSLTKAGESGELPYFLTSPSLGNIFELPIVYGGIQAVEVGSRHAVIEVDIIDSQSELGNGQVYFGTKDALTFAARKLHGTEKKSELSNAINDMTWESTTKATAAKTGINRFELSKLEPDTTYYFRVLANNSVSRIWNDKSMSFKTPKAGAKPQRLRPLVTESKQGSKNQMENRKPMSISGQPFRTWNYRTPTGSSMKFEGRLTGIAGGKVQVERKADGRKATLDLNLFAPEDLTYVETVRKGINSDA